MKYLTTFLIVLALMLTGTMQSSLAQAAEEAAAASAAPDQAELSDPLAPSAPMERTKSPIELKGGTSPLLSVYFNHSSHREINCKNCHHDTSSQIAYSSCREICHAVPGARARHPMSMFMAFHARNTDRSCYGCHARRAEANPEKYPDFKSCRPCHTGS